MSRVGALHWLESKCYNLMTCMVGSHAERQPHIHSTNKPNIENLICEYHLPMIVWPARLSCSPELFCSAALIASSFYLVTNKKWLMKPSLDYETNMALLSFQSGSQLKKRAVHKCDCANTDWLILKNHLEVGTMWILEVKLASLLAPVKTGLGITFHVNIFCGISVPFYMAMG